MMTCARSNHRRPALPAALAACTLVLLSPACEPEGANAQAPLPRAGAAAPPDSESPTMPPPASPAGADPGAAPERRALRKRTASLRELIASAQSQARSPCFLPPNDAEMRRFEAAFGALLHIALEAARSPAAAQRGGLPAPTERLERLNHDFAQLGFELSWLPQQRWIAVAELEGVRRGGGFYLCRARLTRGEDAIVIQAPHSLHDQGSGEIGRALFLEAQADVFMINTAHRKRDAVRGGADLAHLPSSMFQAATRACARILTRARFIQVHGFSSSAHPRLGDAAAVLSQGSAAGIADRSFDALVHGVERCFGAARVRVFRRDADELGATTNVQGRFVNAYTEAHFFHVELSEHARRRLRRDARLRVRLADAIAATAPPPRQATAPDEGATGGATPR